ncbi:MAG: hypothetical protein U0667_12480 [Chloroflexota bacterium]
MGSARVVGMAALGLLVASGAVSAQGGSPSASPSAEPSASVAPSDADAPLWGEAARDLRMTLVTLPSGLPAARLNAVAIGGPGYVAVGATEPEEVGPVDTLVLGSIDGVAWTAADLGELAQAGTLDDVVAGPGGLVAVGSTWTSTGRQDAIALVSTDGLVWRASTDPDLRTAWMAGVALWGDGMVAVGCRLSSDGLCAAPSAWTSTDGLEWDRVSMPATAGDPDAVASGDGLLVVMGVSSAIADGSPVVSTTRDLSTWTVRELGFGGGLSSATVDGDHIIAAGTLVDQDGDVLFRGVVAYSPNAGGRWVRLPLTAPAGSRFSGVSVAGPVIAYGSREAADLSAVPASWVGSTAVDWNRVRGVPAQARGEVSDFVPFADRPGGIAVGATGERGDEPAIWVIETLRS